MSGPQSGAGRRNKGAVAERAVVLWLREHGWPFSERRAGGSAGPDIAGCPGVAFEVKAAKRVELAAWVDQAEAQRAASGADYGPLIIKRPGVTDPGRWYAVLPLGSLAALLTEAGYGGWKADE